MATAQIFKIVIYLQRLLAIYSVNNGQSAKFNIMFSQQSHRRFNLASRWFIRNRVAEIIMQRSINIH